MSLKKFEDYADFVAFKRIPPLSAVWETMFNVEFWKYIWISNYRKGVAHFFPSDSPFASQGALAVDVTLVSLSGETKSLLADYVERAVSDVPIILNFGSYT